MFEVGEQAGGALIAVLGVLGHQAQDQRRQRGGDLGPKGRGGEREAGDVGVDQLQRVRRAKRQLAGEELVEGGAERVIVGAIVDRAIHPAGLLGREIGEAALEHLGRGGGAALLAEHRGDAEVGERDPLQVGADDDVVGLDVLVQDAGGVDEREGADDAGGELEEAGEREAAGREALAQGVAGEVLEHEGDAAADGDEAVGADDAVVVEAGEHGVFVAQAGGVAEGGVLAAEGLQDHGRAVGEAQRAEDDGAPPLAHDAGDLVARDGDHPPCRSGRVIQ
jgi:hypothetical protein